MTQYEVRPFVSVDTNTEATDKCSQGWVEVGEKLRSASPLDGKRIVIAIEVYPGVREELLRDALNKIWPDAKLFATKEAFRTPNHLREAFSDILTDDPVFNRMAPCSIGLYFQREALQSLREHVADTSGIVILLGTGASYVIEEYDLLLHAGVSRWEIQQRQRTHAIGNLGLLNTHAPPTELYKIAYFMDWRVGDDLRHNVYQRVHFFLDLNAEEHPRMLSGADLRAAVTFTVQRPFRVVPFFDPGPWGGQWMRKQFGLSKEEPNFAWGFDCVPEENSVLLQLGARYFELPALVLVHEEPYRMLGESVVNRFGAEFPIRFDLLDTVAGSNFLCKYIRATATFANTSE